MLIRNFSSLFLKDARVAVFELLNQGHLAFSSSARDASHCETIYWLSKDVSKNLSGEGGEGGPNFDGKSKEIFFYNFYMTSNRHSCFCKNFDVR